MLEQQQSGVVCPVQVLDDEQEWPLPAAALEEFQHVAEQVVPLLLRRQVERSRRVRKQLPQRGQHARYLARALTQRHLQRRPVHASRRCVEYLDERRIRQHLHLVAVPAQDQHLLVARLDRYLLREPALAHSRLAAEQHQAPLASHRLLEAAPELLSLALPPDERRPPEQYRPRNVPFPLPQHLVQMPAVRETLKPEAAAIGELEVLDRAEQAFHCLRDEYFVARRLGRDPRRRCDRRTEQIAAPIRALFSDHLAGVDANADRNRLVRVVLVARPHRTLNRDSALDRPSRRREGDHRAVARPLDLLPAELFHLALDKLAVRTEDPLCRLVAQASRQVSRTLDVREEEGQRSFRQAFVHISRTPPAAGASSILRLSSGFQHNPPGVGDSATILLVPFPPSTSTRNRLR